VPVDGYYEWIGEGKKKKPIWFHHPDKSLLLFAGLYDDWKNPETGERMRSFTILTRDAAGLSANFHDRMPVVLPPRATESWLSREADPPDFVDPELMATEVSRRVNSVKNDDAGCLGPPEAEHPRLF